jgi:hypothetical protein
VARNVAELTEPVTLRRRQVQPFEPDEVERLLDVCRADRLGAFYTIAMAVGLRPGEAPVCRGRTSTSTDRIRVCMCGAV